MNRSSSHCWGLPPATPRDFSRRSLIMTGSTPSVGRDRRRPSEAFPCRSEVNSSTSASRRHGRHRVEPRSQMPDGDRSRSAPSRSGHPRGVRRGEFPPPGGRGRTAGLHRRLPDPGRHTDRGIDTTVRMTLSGWRWRWDLNPRWACTHTRFRGVLLRPLGHATAGEGTGPRRGLRNRSGWLQRRSAAADRLAASACVATTWRRLRITSSRYAAPCGPGNAAYVVATSRERSRRRRRRTENTSR